jgi:sarcosine oxidase subunit alpha
MSESKTIVFQVDGEDVHAQEGQTIAEALLNKGVSSMRYTRQDKPRCAFCGMGVCYECRMIVNGIPNVRTCVTPATAGCVVERQHDANLENLEVKI